jgi:hypothetical protein
MLIRLTPVSVSHDVVRRCAPYLQPGDFGRRVALHPPDARRPAEWLLLGCANGDKVGACCDNDIMSCSTRRASECKQRIQVTIKRVADEQDAHGLMGMNAQGFGGISQSAACTVATSRAGGIATGWKGLR